MDPALCDGHGYSNSENAASVHPPNEPFLALFTGVRGRGVLGSPLMRDAPFSLAPYCHQSR
jgi:hypothetical protein